MAQNKKDPWAEFDDAPAAAAPATAAPPGLRLEPLTGVDPRRAIETEIDRERLDDLRNPRGGLPQGWRMVNGVAQPIAGLPEVITHPKSEGDAKLTVDERTAAFLATRVAGGMKDLDRVLKARPDAAKPELGASVAGIFGPVARNYANSPDRQRIEAAQLDILDAALTLGTGAAYTKEQIEGYRQAYFPQLGDAPETIADKQLRLRRVLESAKVKAGNAAPMIDEALATIGGDDAALTDEEARAELEARISRGDDPADTIKWLIAVGRSPTAEQIDAIMQNKGNPRPDVRMPEAVSEGLRSLGLGTRAVVQGAGDIANLVSTPFVNAVNAVAGTNYNPDIGDTAADLIGLPEPENDAERMAFEIARFGTGGFSLAGVARQLIPRVRGVFQKVLQRIADNPVADVVAGSTAGASSESTRQAGGGPVAQAAAGLAGGIAGGAATVAGTARRAAGSASLTPDELARADAAQAAQDLGIDLPKFVVGGKKAAADASSYEQSPFGTKLISSATNKMLEQSEGARARTASTVGKAVEPEAMGDVAREGAAATSKVERKRIGLIYDRARLAANNQDFEANQTADTIAQILKQEDQVLGGTDTGKVVRSLGEDLARRGGKLTIDGARETRSELRKRLRDEAGLTPDKADHLTNQVMKAVNADIESGLVDAGRPKAVPLYREADREWAKLRELEDDVLAPFIGKDGDAWGADVAKRINSDVRGNGMRLAKFIGALPEEEANTVRASLIMRLGRATSGNQDAAGEAFSLDTFLTNWDQVKGARNLIFPKPTVQALDKLAKVAQVAKAAGRTKGHSNTGRSVWQSLSAATMSAGGGASLVTLDPKWAAIGAAAAGLSALKQWNAARLLSSPAFAQKIASTPTSIKGAREYWSRGWVEAMKKNNPGLAADINVFQQGFLRAANENVERSVAASETNEEN